jgi:hypothetical protein
LLNIRKIFSLEFVGMIFMAAIVLFVFVKSLPALLVTSMLPSRGTDLFLPFGPILFALAGWTAIEPAYEWQKRRGHAVSNNRLALALGTIGASLLYLLFVVAIIVSAETVTEDTLSGLGGGAVILQQLLAWLGIFAIWTSYMPIGIEIRKSLHNDLHWSSRLSLLALLLVPPFLVMIGLRDFLSVMGLVGGVFLSAQYILIALVSRRAILLGGVRRLALDGLVFLFALAAIYQVWQFILH